MRARKCDRCGAFYEHYEAKRGYKPNAVRTIERRISDNYSDIDIYDLCPVCMSAFEAFIAAGKVKEADHGQD